MSDTQIFHTVAQVTQREQSDRAQAEYRYATHRTRVGNTCYLCHMDTPDTPISPIFGNSVGLIHWLKANGWETVSSPVWGARRMGAWIQ